MNRGSLKAIVSIEVARQGLSVGWLYREEPDRENDSGWRVFSGAEPDDFADDASNFAILSLEELIELDPAVESVLDAPPGSCYERHEEDGPFHRVRTSTWRSEGPAPGEGRWTSQPTGRPAGNVRVSVPSFAVPIDSWRCQPPPLENPLPREACWRCS
ncbi:MAG: DUF2185 domain-containing protein [Acidobacteria bacterium]|nr:DUF2185 domain-containing protein [Acidobacteriota bacterium]